MDASLLLEASQSERSFRVKLDLKVSVALILGWLGL